MKLNTHAGYLYDKEGHRIVKSSAGCMSHLFARPIQTVTS